MNQLPLKNDESNDTKLGITFKLGLLLAAFGIIASGITAFYTFNTTQSILTQKATKNIAQSTRVLSKRFSFMANKVANDAKYLAQTQLSQQALTPSIKANSSRLTLTDQFRSLLSVHPEYFQVRLIGAKNYGLEQVRVDRDNQQIVTITGKNLQEKKHYPYVYKTLKLSKGQVYYSDIFLNNEKGAHAGLDQPTLQVATPIIRADGKALGVIVINVDLNRLFHLLSADLSEEYSLYLSNQKGDYLIHPNKSMTFGFVFGRRFLIQDDFTPVSSIVNANAKQVSIHSKPAGTQKEVIGSFTRIPFGNSSSHRFVIMGLAVPLDFVLAETQSLIQNTSKIVLISSLIAILFSGLVSLLFVRPIKHLVQIVQRFSNTQELTPLGVNTDDEIGLLSRSINTMQENILGQLNKLNLQNKRLNQEIVEREKIEKFEAFRSHTLELIAENEPINHILEEIVLGIEKLEDEALCSILLLDKEGKRLVDGIAPSLPEFYTSAIDNLEIGMGVGSCGTSAYTGQRVIVEDISTHPYWKDFKDLAHKAQLGACWSQPIYAASGEVLGTFAIYHKDIHGPTRADINLIEQTARLTSIVIEHKRAEEVINSLAFYDSLTRLPNRRLLLDRLSHVITTSKHSAKHAALLFIDLDDFKVLNDSLGHDMGDLLLQQVAQRIQTCVRESDTISRFGGDEFVLLLENLSIKTIEAATQSKSIAKKILEVFNLSYELISHKYNISPSIGITLFNGPNLESDELMKQADIAMYEAKKSGGNELRFFDPTMQKKIMARAGIENELRQAIANQNEFQLYYQQQTQSNKVIGAEALVRWISPTRGIVSPLDFISIAEETGLIFPLGHWILKTACEQLAIWGKQPATEHLSIAVNLSARQIRLPTFVEEVLSIITHTGANPKRLKLEITESIFLEDLDDVIDKMTALKAQGIHFSIDDFGTGYSSLQYLKRLPIDQLKIDQSFVRDIATDHNDRAIVETIVAMAQRLDLEVIAEGVETLDQQRLLKEAGCHNYQGYFFGKPIPIEQFNIALSLPTILKAM